jgi:choline dehydrogenase-like flavoprotein
VNDARSDAASTGDSDLALTGPERALGLVLRLTAFGLFVAALIYALGPFVPPAQDFFVELPFVANSVVKVTILGLVSLYAAGDIRRRRGLVIILIAAHLVSVAAMGSMLAFAETGGQADLGFAHPTVETVLWSAIGLDGMITAVIAGFFFAALRSTRMLAKPTCDQEPLAPAERLLRWVLIAFAVLFVLGGIGYEISPFLDTSKSFAHELPFVTNSVVRMATLAMLCIYAAANLKRNMAMVGPVIAVQFLGVLVGGAYLIHQYAIDSTATVSLLGGQPRLTSVIWGAIGHEAVTGVLIMLAYGFAWRQRFKLTFLWPVSYRGLNSAAEVLVVGGDERITADDIAARVESFLAGFRARRRWLYRVALMAIEFAPLIELRPLPRLNPPLSELDRRSRRRFLEDHFQRLPRQSHWRFIKNVKQIIIRICLQLSYAGYYGDERSYESIGYKPFTARERYAGLAIDEPGEHPLEVERPEQIGSKEIEADVCIVGSGAGGAILAHELAKRGRDVLILERGQYVEPRHFSESEIEMISKLYADGLMQQSEDWRFTVLQGNCVGGSTTVNNAVCFKPPDAVMRRWNDRGAGLDLGELAKSVAAVEELISVKRQAPDVHLNPSGVLFAEGARKLGASPGSLDVDAVRANIEGCYGSGYCNIGCRWNKKLSMLQRVLPEAQKVGRGSVRILAECEVERVFALSGRPRHVTGLYAKFPDGRDLRVRAKDYVLSAGAVASSYLLLRSGIARDLPVGEGFSANMGAPLTAEFDGDPINAYDGLQISHYGVPEKDGFVFETWFNPPVSQALNMPGWFEEHTENMRRYDHLMAVGVVVGTASNGQVRKALTGGPGIDFRPRPEDLRTLARGLKLLGEILFAGDRKPKRLMLNTWGRDEFTSPDQLSRLDAICQDPDYIALGTGHPQGGNVLSEDPKRGVIDPDFKVHNFDNLHICDASVFPASLTVNPQLTVMSLAHYAASRIA